MTANQKLSSVRFIGQRRCYNINITKEHSLRIVTYLIFLQRQWRCYRRCNDNEHSLRNVEIKPIFFLFLPSVFGCLAFPSHCRIARNIGIGYSGQICNTKINYQVRFIGQWRYYKYYEEQTLRYILYIILSKRRSAKYRLPTEIYSPLWRIWTLKADGLTTHRERSLSVHCLHSSVLFFIIFRHRCFLLFNFPYHILPIRETEDTMPVKFFGQAFSINHFQCFCYHPFYVFGKQAYPYR